MDASKLGQQRGLEIADTIVFRWRRRYNLAPTDPRFLDMTFAELVTDFWAHLHVDDPELRRMQQDDDFEATLRELGFDEADLAQVGDAPPSNADGELVEDVDYREAAP